MRRLYPRATLRKLIHAHIPDMELSEHVDILIYLNYLLFLQQLCNNAINVAKPISKGVYQQRSHTASLSRSSHHPLPLIPTVINQAAMSGATNRIDNASTAPANAVAAAPIEDWYHLPSSSTIIKRKHVQEVAKATLRQFHG
ncbi:hypothetical protein BDF22DRAFT_698832 [Syncephalis plumigaleata]|nr:hypothetical protein BDF22DRAFT_698832 [Syncephalis plumigaleata]